MSPRPAILSPASARCYSRRSTRSTPRCRSRAPWRAPARAGGTVVPHIVLSLAIIGCHSFGIYTHTQQSRGRYMYCHFCVCAEMTVSPSRPLTAAHPGPLMSGLQALGREADARRRLLGQHRAGWPAAAGRARVAGRGRRLAPAVVSIAMGGAVIKSTHNYRHPSLYFIRPYRI